MRISLFIKAVALSGGLLLMGSHCFGQYGGYGGGYGGMGGGYGRGMGSSMGGGANFKPQMPNIAGEMATKETKWMKDNLNLTKDQAKAIKTLNNDYAKLQQEAIKEIMGSDGSRGKSNPDAGKEVRDAMMMYNEEKEDKQKAILTPEQWVLYQSKKPDMQREIGGIRPPAPKGMVRDSTAAAKQ